MLALEDEMFVDLVGDDEQVPFDGEFRDGRQFLASEDRAGRVVRGVEQDQAGAVGDGGAQFVEVQVVRAVAGAQGDRDACAARHADTGRVRVVVRLQGDHLVARLHQREQRGGDRLGGARRDEDLGVRVVRQTVEAPLVRGDGRTQFGYAGARRVLIAAPVAQRPDRGLPDLLGAVGVGETLAEVDRSGPYRQRRHLREDRRAAEPFFGHDGHPVPNLWSCSSQLWAPDAEGTPQSRTEFTDEATK